MPTNMNIVRLSNQLEQIKGDVKARIERCKDENGDPNSEAFRAMNPEINIPLGEWLAARTEEAVRVQSELDDYLKVDGALGQLDDLMNLGRQKATRTPFPSSEGKFSIGAEVMKSEDFGLFTSKKIKEFSSDEFEVGLKALFESVGANAADHVNVEAVRTGEYIMAPRTRVTLLDIIPQISTDQGAVKYDEETKNLSGAAPVAQGATYQQSQFTIEEKSVDISKVGVYIQTSEEALMDRPQLENRINNNLMAQMYRRVQADVVGGALQNTDEYIAGAANNTNVTGLLDIADANINVIDGNAGESTGDYRNPITVLEEGAEMVYRIGEAEASAILMNSQDWVKMKTLQATTGAFVLRGANAPLWMPVERAIDEWRVVLCNALPAGTTIIGDYMNHCAIRDRQAVQVRIQEAQSVVVDGNAQTVQTQPSGRYNIYSDARFAFIVFRGLAFTKITNFFVGAS